MHFGETGRRWAHEGGEGGRNAWGAATKNARRAHRGLFTIPGIKYRQRDRSMSPWEESTVKALERAAATPNNYFFSEPFSHTSRVVKLQDLHLNSVAAPELGGA